MGNKLKAGLGPRFKFLGTALLLALAVAVRAADVRAVPEVSLPPLLVGAGAQAAPVWRALDAQAATLAALPPAQAAAALAQAAAPDAEPTAVLSARVLARAAAEPQAAAALLAAHPDPAGAERLSAAASALRPHVHDDALASLAQAAKMDPAAAALFDGSGAAPASLEISAIQSKGLKLRHGGQKMNLLGQGEFGAVYEHPTVPGAIVKAVEHGFEIILFGDQTVTQTADQEEQTSRALAAADAGPRYFGRAVVSRRELSVRERIYGETMESLVRDRRFGEEERALVQDLLRRMAKARLLTDDKRAPNIMIGRTLLDPRRRAYLIDGGKMLPVDPALSEDQLYETLLHQETVLRVRVDPHVGVIVHAKPFSRILDEGVARTNTTSRWKRFVAGLKEAFSHVHTPMR